MTLRRERERAAVLAKAVAEMRRQGKAECETPELFTDFKGIQVTMAVMAQALIDGRIDCKTAGRLVVHLQTMSKLLWMVHRKSKSTTEARRHGKKQGLPQICADERRLNRGQELPVLPAPQTAAISTIGRGIYGEDRRVVFDAKLFPEKRRSLQHGKWEQTRAS